MKKNLNSLPVFFEQGKTVADGRFMNVKIYVAHVGLNRNYSNFSKEALINLYSSIGNTPIVGYVDEKAGDFAGHETRITIERDEVEYVYLGRAYGFIPQPTTGPTFEMKTGEDGVEREYLVAEGLMWTKFEEVMEIFSDSSWVKSQSMEVMDIEGSFDEEGVFHYTNAVFDAACILGSDVTPAMVSSTIEAFSENVGKQVKEMFAEFSAYYNDKKGDDKMSQDNIIITQPDVESTVNHSEEPIAEPTVTDEQTTEEGVIEDTTVNHSEEGEATPEASEEPEATEDVEPDTDHSVQDESPVEPTVSVEEFEALKAENEKLKGDLADVTAEFADAKTELDELRPLKAEKEFAEKKEQLDKFNKTLTEEEYAGLLDKLDKFSVDEIRVKVGEVLVTRVENGEGKFSNDESNKAPIVKSKKTKIAEDKADNPYGVWASFAKE